MCYIQCSLVVVVLLLLLLLLPLPPLSEQRYYVARRHAVCVSVCPPSRLCHVSTVYRISLGGEGNVLYHPVLSLVVVVISGAYHYLC